MKERGDGGEWKEKWKEGMRDENGGGKRGRCGTREREKRGKSGTKEK
jgi:hypothetical protein